MKIVADDKIPFLRGLLEKYAEVIYLPGASISSEDLNDADALLTRTRTKCNKSLLEGSSVKLIASATIGFDHIDCEYCEKNGIFWTNAPGCNSSSVQQYILSVLFTLRCKYNFDLKDKTIGIIGVGNVGKKVAVAAKNIGMKVLLNDPPRERAEGCEQFVSLNQLLSESDFVTCHTPLNMDGMDKTFHLSDMDFFSKMKRSAFYINSSRGEVTDTEALKSSLKKNYIAGAVIDVWENEPTIDTELLELVDLGTPHIAGYSADGKANGTSMSVNVLADKFGLPIKNWFPDNVPLPENFNLNVDLKDSLEQMLSQAIFETYDISSDDRRLRNSVSTFEKQRGNYPLRREFPVYHISSSNSELNKILKSLGFKTEDI